MNIEKLTKTHAVALGAFLGFVTVNLSSVQADTVKLAYLLIAFCVSVIGVVATAKIYEHEQRQEGGGR